MRATRIALLPVFVGTMCAPARALADPAGASLLLEATFGGGWRTSINSDDRNPGFELVGASGELLLGLSFGDVALVAEGRGRAGSAAGNACYEAAGSLGLELSLGEHIHARAGADAGRMFLGGPAPAGAPLVGGFLAMSFEAARFASGHLAAVLSLRLDVDAVLGEDERFPKISPALGAGIGIRY